MKNNKLGLTQTAHFFVALHKMSLVVLFIQLVSFCLGASNYARLRKSYKHLFSIIAFCAVFSTILYSAPVYASTTVTGASHTLFTYSGFVDLLISKGIIAESKAEKARAFLAVIEKKKKTTDEDVEVTVSQYIEHGDLTYSRYQNIEGLLLTVKNMSDTTKTLIAKRGCQVVYRIYDEVNTLVYNSADDKKCQTNEKVSYVLEAGATRIFPITHSLNKYALKVGTYRFEIEYPEYGKGERTITVE